MKQLTIPTSLALALALFVLSAWSAVAEDLASSIVGLWKITSFTRKEVATGKTEHPYGEHPTGYILYTRGGHFIYYNMGENRKAPATPTPTDAERAELFKTLVAYSGTYRSKVMRLLHALMAPGYSRGRAPKEGSRPRSAATS
jgi:hypothetical protein